MQPVIEAPPPPQQTAMDVEAALEAMMEVPEEVATAGYPTGGPFCSDDFWLQQLEDPESFFLQNSEHLSERF